MCLKIDARILRAAAQHRPSAELWALIDRVQRKDIQETPIPESTSERPAYLISPLTPEQVKAADDADAARYRVEQRIAAMNAHRARRAEDCGIFTIYLGRETETGGVERMLARPPCGRSCCAYCMRQRLIRTYNRACAILLDAPSASLGGVGRLPRVGVLYVAETTWARWKSFDRQVRRQVGGDCGRLRVRRQDDTVLLVCEQPFRGSRPLSPAETMDLAAAAIDAMHRDKHAFRTLGSWNIKRVKRWEAIKEYGRPFDLTAIHAELATLGVTARRWQQSGFSALLWRAESGKDAAKLWAACPTLANGGVAVSTKTKSDQRSLAGRAIGGRPHESELPSSLEPEFDPGASPWG